MFIRIHTPKTVQSGNSGSCKDLVNYLEKENELEGTKLQDQEFFFSYDNERVGSNEAIHRIDKNVAKLGKKDAKFYMLSINPSQKEQEYLAEKVVGKKVKSLSEMNPGQREKFTIQLREYSRNVMESYAENFNKGLEGKDLVYFGKVEHGRKYSRFDEVVKTGERKAGELKEGFQSHIHIVVSRKDATNKVKLSPFTNHRNSKNILDGREVQMGFDRKRFVQEGERKFDSQFGYQRYVQESFEYRYQMRNAMASIFNSYANQVTEGAYMNAAGAVNNYKNLKQDPLRILSGMAYKNSLFRNANKVAGFAAQPQKLVVEVVKKVPQVVSRAATIKM